jgi:peptidoglycan/LPS O-acetylase OafA/YrhL
VNLLYKQQERIQSTSYIPQLDGLRGIAILMVVCFHYFPNTFLFRFGWSGVDLFFVLSGYLLTGRLLPYLDDKKILQKFYWNRFVRIVPLYFTFLIVFFAIWFLFASKQTLSTYPYYSNHWLSFFIFIQNWVFIHYYPSSPGGLTHLWSLAVEEQFYLLFPLFILLIRERRKLFFTAVFLVIVIVIIRSLFFYLNILNGDYEKTHWNTFFRLDSFFIGFILFLLIEKKITFLNSCSVFKYLSLFSFIILLTEICILKNPDARNSFYTTVGYTIVAIVYAALICFILSNNNFLTALTKKSFLKYTGKISYCIFIIHYPLYIAGFGLLNKFLHMYNITITNNALVIINGVCCLPLTYFISHLSFKYYEQYFLKWKYKPGATFL